MYRIIHRFPVLRNKQNHAIRYLQILGLVQ